MAFEFKKEEPVSRAAKRLARKQIEKALQDLESWERLDAVHEVRKDIKQLRALLRLVRMGMKDSDYRQCSARLRETAKKLAAARDAQVKVDALAGLADHFKGELSSHSLEDVKRALTANSRKQRARLSRARTPKKVGHLLRCLSRNVGCLKLKASGWAVIRQGIKKSYRKGRRGYLLAKENGTPQRIHQWRKRVKDLQYQAGLLCPIWPEHMRAAVAELNQLGECLGDYHDLSLLTERPATKRLRKGAPQEPAMLKTLVGRRQSELRAQALALGDRIYQEEPSVFCKRLGRHWKRWRREPKRCKSVVR